MVNALTAANRDRYLTVGWNNALVVGLGLPALMYSAIALSTSAVSDRFAFISLVVIGAVY